MGTQPPLATQALTSLNACVQFFASFPFFFWYILALCFLTFSFSFLHLYIQPYLLLSYLMIIFYVAKKLYTYVMTAVVKLSCRYHYFYLLIRSYIFKVGPINKPYWLPWAPLPDICNFMYIFSLNGKMIKK